MRTRVFRRKWAVFISGRGSNLQAILDLLPESEIVQVYSSKKSAPGILRARRAGVPVQVLPTKIDWAQVASDLRVRGVSHLFLAGFMKIIPAEFVQSWAGKTLNVHPSLLPAYPGMQALEKSYAEKAEMGVTLHVVTEEMDAGPRLYQRKTLPAGNRTQEMSEAQLRTSQAEQRLVREAVLKWK